MRPMTASCYAAAAILFFMASGLANAQTPTGTISGHVVDGQGLSVPGVVVTVQSPSLQGSRTAVTSGNGDYVIPLLPPGPYTVTFELGGFGTVTERRDVAATQPVALDVTMRPAAVSEVVNVTGRTDAFVNTVQSSTNIKASTLSLVNGSSASRASSSIGKPDAARRTTDHLKEAVKNDAAN